MKIGIDLGGSHIGIGLLSNDNELIEKIEKNRDNSFNSEKDIINLIDNYINQMTEKYQIDLIGIATPGNVQDNKMKNLFNLGIEQIDFNAIINKYSSIHFQIENDSKAAAKAELRYGALKEENDAVFLCLGTGIGSAVFLNRRLLKANRNEGFELGHMIIQKDGLQCNCGKKGCFETYCSIKRFKDNIRKSLQLPEVSAEELVNIIKMEKENLVIKELVNNYIENLIVGLSNVIDIFEPDKICLGGSFVYFKEIFFDELKNRLERRKYVFNKENIPELVLAELKNDAGIIGAVLE